VVAKRVKVKKFEDLVIFRGSHICTSRSFMKHFPKMFISQEEPECEKLLNHDIFKLPKIKLQQRQYRFLEKFKEFVIKSRYKD